MTSLRDMPNATPKEVQAKEAKKRGGLGRGLDALFKDARKEEESFEPKIKRADEMVALAAATTTMPGSTGGLPAPARAPRKLPIDLLRPGKFQPRRHFDDEALQNLADSIAVHGVLQPICVRAVSGGMYEIIAGERRWRAAQKARVHDVPVVIQDLTDNEALEIALIENLQREDLTALEEAEGYQRLMDEFRHTQDVLAQRLGKSRSHVTNMLRLLKLPQRIKKYMQDGQLSAGHARALVGVEGAEKIADIIVKRGLSVRQTEKLVKDAVAGKAKPKAPVSKSFVPRDVDELALEEKLSSILGMDVTVLGEGQAGVLSIHYASLEQLDDVIARLSRAPLY